MAKINEMDQIEDAEFVEEVRDSAKDLTSGIVITTTVLLLGALLVTFAALNTYFGVGPFAG